MRLPYLSESHIGSITDYVPGSSTLRLRPSRLTVFHLIPARAITSGVILDRLLKGKASGTNDGLGHRPTAVPPDSGIHCCFW